MRRPSMPLDPRRAAELRDGQEERAVLDADRKRAMWREISFDEFMHFLVDHQMATMSSADWRRMREISDDARTTA
jgi:hypothetical protein